MSTLLAILLANTLLAALLAGGGWLAMRYARSPSLAHCLWVLTLIKLVTPPLVTFPVGWKFQPEQFFLGSETKATRLEPAIAHAPGASPPAPVGPAEAQGARNAKPSSKAAGLQPRSRAALRFPCNWQMFSAAIVVIWVGGSLSMAFVLAWRAQAFQRSLDRCISPDGELSRRTWSLARQAGLRQAPQVLRAAALLSPMLWGIGKRVRLVFPAELLERLSESEVDALLLHELGHFARGDHHVRLLELLCRVLFWWHPLMWLALSHLEEAEEHCCDAWVVAHRAGQQRSYAEALLATIDFLNEEHVLARPIASGVGDARLLRQRLVEIMAGGTMPTLSPTSRLLAWLAGGLLLIVHPALGNVTWQLPGRSASPLARPAPSSIPSTRESTLAESSAARRASLPEAANPRPAYSPSNSQWDVLRPPASLWASATSPGAAYRLEARAGRQVSLVHVGTSRQTGLGSYRITCVAFSPTGKSFFTGDEEGILREWDSETGEVLHWWSGQSGEISSLHVSPDGSQLATGTLDGMVSVWQTSDRAEIGSFARRNEVIGCVRWSPDGARLAIAVGGWSDNVHPELIVIDRKTAAESRFDLEQPAGALTWLKDPNLLIAAGWNGRAVVWDIEAGAPRSASHVPKEEVSAAAWCAHCPLVLRWVPEEL